MEPRPNAGDDGCIASLDNVAHPVVVACSDSLQARVICDAHPCAERAGAAGVEARCDVQTLVAASLDGEILHGAGLVAAGVAEAFRSCHLGEPRRGVSPNGG